MPTRDDSAAERRWRRLRVPNLLFTWGPAATVTLYLALTWSEPVAYIDTIGELVSWRVAVDEILFGAMAVLCVMGWLVPRITAVALIVSISPLAEPVQDPAAQHLWILWCGVLALDWILRAWQRSLHVADGDVPARDLAARVRHRRSDLFLVERRVAVGLLATGVLVTSWFWMDRRQELIQLDARAEPASGTVTRIDTVDDVVVVRVAGTRHEFWVGDAASLRVGQNVPVLVDPTGRERPYGLGDADPDSWTALLVLVGVLSTLMVLAAGYGPLQRRRLAARVGAGEPGRTVLVGHDGDGALAVWTVGADPRRDAASALLPAVTPLDEDAPDVEDAPDRDAGDWANLCEWDDEDDGEDAWELDASAPEPATVHGLRDDGGPTVVVCADGTTLISLRSARDPWTTSALIRRSVARIDGILGRS